MTIWLSAGSLIAARFVEAARSEGADASAHRLAPGEVPRAAALRLTLRLPGWIEGFQPDKLSGTRLRLSPGFCASADGRDLAAAAGPIDVDLNTVGALGRDSPALDQQGDYFVYILKHRQTGEASAIVSASQTYSGVLLPRGYTILRKLRFGFVYNSAQWGGIPDFHVAYWPTPYVSFTGFEDHPRWDALTEGSATTFTRISLAGYLPDNARLARVQVVVRSSGEPGSAYLRSWGGQQTGVLAGVVSAPGQTESTQVFDIRVNSRRELEYRVTGGARVTLKVMGYSMTEPS